MRGCGGRSVLLPLVVLLGGCASGRPDPVSAPVASAPPQLEVADLEENALLLLLADRQVFDAFTAELALGGEPETRRLLALTLARVPRAEALPIFEVLAADPDPEVRRLTAFGLGRVGSDEALSLLDGLLRDPETEVAAWATHGLGRAGRSLPEITERLASFPLEERLRRVVPDLHLFAGEGVRELAMAALDARDPWLRRRGAFALARRPEKEARELYLRLLADGDAGVRSLGAAALGAVGERPALQALRLLVEKEKSARVLVSAVAAAARIVAEARSAPPATWRATLLLLFEHPDPAVRLQALRASGRWLLDEEIGRALLLHGRSGDPEERVAAIAALAAGRHPEAGDLAVLAAGEADPRFRVAAANASVALGASALLERLSRDPAPRVRATALVGQAGEAENPQSVLRRALEDPDPGVRAVGLMLLAESPVLPFEEIVACLLEGAPRLPELELSAVEALARRGLAVESERGAVVAVLERLAQAPSYAVRTRAIAALTRMDRPPPPAGPATTRRSVGDYRSIVVRTRRPRWLRLETDRGEMVIRLDCSLAPLSCLSFDQLAAQGYFDGTVVDRVETGRWLEAGAPRPDGFGGPGFELRDEPAARRFVPGVMGLMRPAPHAAGGRFFVLFAEAPELEGTHAPLGEVVSGQEILPDLVPGTRILSVRRVEGLTEMPAPAKQSSPFGPRDDR